MWPELDALLYWMQERENIREGKEAGLPKPWTHDKVLQENYFCNVRREDDKVTRWIRDNWKMNYDQDKHLLAMTIARMVNYPETLEKLGYPKDGWDFRYQHNWTHVMNRGGKVWGSAYIVSTNGRAMPKEEYIGMLLRDMTLDELSCGSLALAYQDLMELPGIGSFMAGQIIADLKNTPNHELAKAPDWFTWCAHGPGSLRGMAWALGEEKITPTVFYRHFPALHELVQGGGWKDLHAQDLQNCLCEFDKYMRVSKGTGRSKRKYSGS